MLTPDSHICDNIYIPSLPWLTLSLLELHPWIFPGEGNVHGCTTKSFHR